MINRLIDLEIVDLELKSPANPKQEPDYRFVLVERDVDKVKKEIRDLLVIKNLI